MKVKNIRNEFAQAQKFRSGAGNFITGTDALILKIFSTKILAKNWLF
jgi:hypothetical protein